MVGIVLKQVKSLGRTKFLVILSIIHRKNIIVQSSDVAEPVAVRYLFKDWVIGNLYNTQGLPVAPFRTDDW